MAKSKGYSVDHFGFLTTQAFRSIGERLGVPLPEATITEDNINSSTLTALRDAAINAVRRTKAGSVGYNDYRTGGSNMLSTYNYGTGFGSRVAEIGKILSSVEAGSAAQSSFGKGEVFIDNKNNMYFVDKYNFQETPENQKTDRIVQKVHELFEPGNVFAVSDKNARKVMVNLGQAPEDIAARLKSAGRFIPSPVEAVAEDITDQDLYNGSFVDAMYNTVAASFNTEGKINSENVPLEFISFMREKLNNFFDTNPNSTVVSVDELDMPEQNNMPAVMNYIAAEKKEDGSYNLFDKFKLFAEEAGGKLGDMLDIDVSIPTFDDLVGNIPDIPVDMITEKPTLPIAILSDDRVKMMNTAIEENLYNKPDDDLSFGEAFAKNRKAGVNKFSWRGNEYTTQYAEEVNNVNAA